MKFGKQSKKYPPNNLCICGIIRSFATAFAQSLSGTTEKAWYVA